MRETRPESHITSPDQRQRQRLAAGAALCLNLLACCALSGCTGLTMRDADARLAHRERQLASGQLGARDESAERRLHDDLCLIDPANCSSVRIYAVDRPLAQARIWPNRMLVVSRSLLSVIDESGDHATAQRLFALSHELAHLHLDHFRQRDAPGWDRLTSEIAADRWAMRELEAQHLSPSAGIDLLRAVQARGGIGDEASRSLDQRIEAMRAAQGPAIQR